MSNQHESQLQIPADSPRFDGHFVGKPVYPAVAQLIDWVLPAISQAYGVGEVLSLQRAKWLAPLGPGDLVTLVLQRSGDKVAFRILRDEVPVCLGSLLFASPAS